jgi:hypothetical protein
MRKLYFLFLLTAFSANRSFAQAGTNLLYDGVDDYLQMPANLVQNVTGDFTIEAWVFWKGGNQSFQRIIDFGNDQNNWVALTASIPFGSTGPRFAINFNGTLQIVDATAALPQNTWSHLAVTLDAATSTATIYIDGVASGSTGGFTNRLSDLGATVNDWLGQSEFAGDPYYNGNIEELRISDVVRYTADFAPVPQVQFTPDPSTVALFHFNEGSGQFTADATGNFGDATLGSDALPAGDANDPTWVTASVLPVKLTSFTVGADQNGHTVDVRWTASMDDNSDFIVERSANGSDFSALTTISASSAGTTSRSFSYHDAQPLPGRSFYRLKCIEEGSAAVYSRIIPVNFTLRDQLILYPNPVRGNELHIELVKPYTGEISIIIYNAAGQVVYQSRQVVKAQNEFTVKRNAALTSGNYTVEVTRGGVKQSSMIVCQ